MKTKLEVGQLWKGASGNCYLIYAYLRVNEYDLRHFMTVEFNSDNTINGVMWVTEEEHSNSSSYESSYDLVRLVKASSPKHMAIAGMDDNVQEVVRNFMKVYRGD